MVASLGGFSKKTDYDANTILAATADDTPASLTVAEQRLVGRITSGAITGLTAAEILTLINVASGAEVNPDVVGQAEAEAGTATTERIFTAQRVSQAIAALAASSAPGFESVDATYQSSGTSINIAVPGNTLTVDGEHLYIEALYESAASGQTSRLSWDGTVLQQAGASIESGERGVHRAWIYRTGSSAQTIVGKSNRVRGANTAGTVWTQGSTDTANFGGSINVLADWFSAGSNKVLSLKVWKVSP